MLLATDEAISGIAGTRISGDGRTKTMKLRFATLATLALLLGAVAPAVAKPNNQCTPEMAAAALADLAVACPCDQAVNHGQYVSCGAHWAARAVREQTLPRACRRLVRKNTVRSVCGKPNFVTCCRTGFAGTRCIVRTETACLHVGGTVGATESCADACTASPSGAFLDSPLF